MKLISNSVVAVVSLIALSSNIPVDAKTFEIDDSMGRDVVSFNSNAPIELIVGRTNKITGEVVIDDSLALKGKDLSAEFKVDLASIDTGIKMRNQHMRDNFLETKKYPTATFKVSKISSKNSVLKPGQTVKLMATGEFCIHGKMVKKKIPVNITYFPPCPPGKKKSQACDAITIRATFPVKLDEHGIKRPEMLMQKLADTVFVTVSATARSKDLSKASSL